jgi:hypothetical protein
MSESTNTIGVGSCPVCNNGKAKFGLTKKQLVCVTCNACNIQLFARSDRSDELLRARIKPAETPAPAATQQAETVRADEKKAVREIAPKTEERKSFLSW